MVWLYLATIMSSVLRMQNNQDAWTADSSPWLVRVQPPIDTNRSALSGCDPWTMDTSQWIVFG
jgi:hypothetical protein